MATLYQISEDGSQTKRWELGAGPLVVGRSGQVHVSIQDDGLSRQHFVILPDGDDYLIKDLSSRNGTWLDGRRVFAEKLHHNGHILAGRTKFLFAGSAVESPIVNKLTMGPHGTVVMWEAPQPADGIAA